MPNSKEGLARLVEREGVHPGVVEAFKAIDRAAFVPEDSTGRAYRDRPIGIPDSQTTSQPTLIARMIDALRLTPDGTVLEVGTGYGFQTALLAQLAGRVISIERYGGLAATARGNLERAGIQNVEVIVGDGWEGVPDRAPFDRIIVSAAASEVPEALVTQLREEGRMVIPVRARVSDAVYVFEKRDGELQRLQLLTPACFVPLIPGAPE